ncbi:pentapeptide repeat-containing protein [Nonomuraea sp. NPDC005650]|uniref:pentapeptide repeat-containing protein n=1 Tax=Nonomuraea sp. NPDC005650 TaxID=3157045 RepID=UPI0033BB802B
MKRLTVLVPLIVVVAGALAVACVVFAPAWIISHDLGVGGRSALSAVDRLKAVNDVRSTLMQGLAAVVALGGIALGAVMTLRQIRVHREGQFIDRFTKAIEQLSGDHVGTRMGGVYALEQIAEVAPHYRGHIAALLASFVRQQAPWPPSRPMQEVDAERQRYHGGLRDDIGGAMAALGRRAMIPSGVGIELEKVDLRGADLSGQDLSGFCFADSNLDDAILAGCDLSNTTFTGASLRNADLTGAVLVGADFADSGLEGIAGIGVTPAELDLAAGHATTRAEGQAEAHP